MINFVILFKHIRKAWNDYKKDVQSSKLINSVSLVIEKESLINEIGRIATKIESYEAEMRDRRILSPIVKNEVLNADLIKLIEKERILQEKKINILETRYKDIHTWIWFDRKEPSREEGDITYTGDYLRGTKSS